MKRFPDKSVRDPDRTQSFESLRQEVSNAARKGPWQKDKNSVTGAGQRRHAVMEKIDGPFLVLGRKENPLGFPCRPGRLERHNPADFTLRYAEKPEGLPPDVLRRCEGKSREVLKTQKVPPGNISQTLPVKRAARFGPIDRLPKPPKLAVLDTFPAQVPAPCTDTFQDPSFQGGYLHAAPSAGAFL
jgi:hypothetical protein